MGGLGDDKLAGGGGDGGGGLGDESTAGSGICAGATSGVALASKVNAARQMWYCNSRVSAAP